MRGIDYPPETITAPRTDPIYNCHAYLTKVPIHAIKPFVEAFTAPGEVVADFYAGSGMTGLAALSSGRQAKLSDISVLGQHIAYGYLQNVESDLLRAVANEVMTAARNAMGNLYRTQRNSDGAAQEMIRTVWSFTYFCPSCGSPLVYHEHLDKNGKAREVCPACRYPFSKRAWKRGDDVPVAVVVEGENGYQIEQPVSERDRKAIRKAQNDERVSATPSLTIGQDREMYSRSGLGKAGLTETRLFFSPRNSIALFELWRAINAVQSDHVRQKLRFAFTAILTRASKRYQWGPKRPLNAQNQTYYIAPVYYEWNVFELYERKVNAAVRASELLFGKGMLLRDDGKEPSVSYDLLSADKLQHLADNSVDYVFTDPPFGSNIFYSDMSLFHEAWLGRVTDYELEAVVHTTGNRKRGAEGRYERLLRKSFEEAWRVLKPGRFMSVVFGNSSGRVWGLVQRALRDAGFKSAPVHVAILDKGQRSVKGLNSGSERVVTVDLILTVQKPRYGECAGDIVSLVGDKREEFVVNAIRDLSPSEARNPSHVYARVLRKAIHAHLVLDEFHLGDVLISLRNAGYVVDQRTGMLSRTSRKVAA